MIWWSVVGCPGRWGGLLVEPRILSNSERTAPVPSLQFPKPNKKCVSDFRWLIRKGDTRQRGSRAIITWPRVDVCNNFPAYIRTKNSLGRYRALSGKSDLSTTQIGAQNRSRTPRFPPRRGGQVMSPLPILHLALASGRGTLRILDLAKLQKKY